MFNFGHWNRPIDADRLHRVNPLLNMCVCFAVVLNETCLVGCMLKMSLVWILKSPWFMCEEDAKSLFTILFTIIVFALVFFADGI